VRFKVTMKDPDTLQDAIAEAVRAEVKAIEGLSDDERETVEEQRQYAELRVCTEWFRHGEYLTVEVDTEARTATVCPAR
jgi:hypothetical protein